MNSQKEKKGERAIVFCLTRSVALLEKIRADPKRDKNMEKEIAEMHHLLSTTLLWHVKKKEDDSMKNHQDVDLDPVSNHHKMFCSSFFYVWKQDD